ncbi:MAG: universal stress protein [Thermodesulfobacteriota bacterium]
MGRKILVAFDDSNNAMRAIQFVAETFTPDNIITIFSVIQDSATLCEMNSPELTPYFVSQQESFCILEDKKKELIKEAQEKAKKLLMDAGFSAKHIILKLNRRKKGVARDIIEEANSGYDMVVMGRRGLSGIKEFVYGSISQKVLQMAKDVSVLIVN